MDSERVPRKQEEQSDGLVSEEERREHPRWDCDHPGVLAVIHGLVCRVRVRNLSAGGALLHVTAELPSWASRPNLSTLELANRFNQAACILTIHAEQSDRALATLLGRTIRANDAGIGQPGAEMLAMRFHSPLPPGVQAALRTAPG